MKNIRIASIENGNPNFREDGQPARLKLGLRKMPSGEFCWFNLSIPDEGVLEGPQHKTVAQAMNTLFAWYDAPGWWLVTSHHPISDSR